MKVEFLFTPVFLAFPPRISALFQGFQDIPNSSKEKTKKTQHGNSLQPTPITRRHQPKENPPPDQICEVFLIYDCVIRRMLNVRSHIDWESACEPFQQVNEYICPSSDVINAICAKPFKSDLNPSVRFDYCEPLFAGLEDPEERLDCVRACIRYTSRDRGNCCEFQCN